VVAIVAAVAYVLGLARRTANHASARERHAFALDESLTRRLADGAARARRHGMGRA
jgi:hypothetical protein